MASSRRPAAGGATPLKRRAWTFGLTAMVVYAIAAVWVVASGSIGVRPLYDGNAPPPPYRWVDPPKDLEADNETPQVGHSVVEFTPEGSKGINVFTADGQAFFILPIGAFKPVEGQTGVSVDITPKKPAKSAKAPKGFEVDGNAYVYTAKYVPSGAPTRPVKDATVVMRFPVSASKIGRLEAGNWVPLKTDSSPQSSQLFTKTRKFGTYAALGHSPVSPKKTPWWAFAAGGSAVAITLAVFLARRKAGKRSSAVKPESKKSRKRRR